MSMGNSGIRHHGPVRTSAAFTLIEILIATSLMALILVAAYACLQAGLAGRETVEPRADLMQNTRVALAMLTADLRGACPLSEKFAFLGMKRSLGPVEADNLDFATHHHTPRHPREGDFCEVSYYVEKDQDGRFSLWRRQNPVFAPKPLEGGRKEQIARDILGVRYEYTDGDDWYDTWGDQNGQVKAEESHKDRPNLTGLPAAVRITLFMDADPKVKADSVTGKRATRPPLVFQTVAHLELADTYNDPDNSPTAQGAGQGMNPNAGPVPAGGFQ